MLLTILISVGVISSIGAALAALLVVSERLFVDYGPCRININEEREFTVDGGRDLLSALISEKIFIPSACGGRGTCGLCKLKVLEGAGPLLPTEEPFLERSEIESSLRLACQVKVREDLKIEIPQELLSVKEYTCKCAEIVDLTHDTKQFRLEFIGDETMDYIPGQYIQLLTPVYEKSSEEVYRAYSISSDPAEKGAIELIIRLVPGGICTTYCFEYLKVGDEMKINGPYGDFMLSDSDSPIVFIAGGSGMAPIKAILLDMIDRGIDRKTTYFFGAVTQKDLFLVEEMKELEGKLPRFSFVPALSAPAETDNWQGETGLITDVLDRYLENGDNKEAYLCGSPGMIDACIAVLTKNGVPDELIFYDKFA